MTPDERAKMRDTLRVAVSRALLPGAQVQHPGPIALPLDPPEHLVERFRAQLTALGGTVHELASTDGIADLIATLARAEVARGDAAPAALMWHADQLPVSGLDVALAARGVRVLPQTADDLSSVDRRQDLAETVVGVTGAHAGLAETGSVVLASGPGRSRLASLLPPVHVAVLDRQLIVESLTDVIVQRPELMTSGANVVCITGPSRTADIEHTLTRGVHGPREVHVVLVN
jgi:L-lactate dehydrogenase complex protein LldG